MQIRRFPFSMLGKKIEWMRINWLKSVPVHEHGTGGIGKTWS